MSARAVSLLALVGLVTARAPCSEDGGNWYCKPVQRISYKGVSAEGSYDRVVGMDAQTGECKFEKKMFGGAMAPLNEDLSVHFRGPLVLKRFAVYKPDEEVKKRGMPRAKNRRRRGARRGAKRNVGDMVIATINGEVVSWLNVYDGRPVAQPTVAVEPPKKAEDVPVDVVAAPPPVVTVTVTVQPSECAATSLVATTPPLSLSVARSTTVVPTSSSPPSADPIDDTDWKQDIAHHVDSQPSDESPTAQSGANWRQAAFYEMDNGTAEGVTFMNNLGRNGLTFASADGTSGATSAEVFAGELKSQQEITIFSGVNCETGSCGYYQPGSTAYEGFGGAEKAFFLEFSMPDDGATEGFNKNMPAIWLLNAQVPRTQQYGACSCWKTGCGEFDIFETLAPGDGRAKSTFHKRHAGGSSDYFDRPVDGFIKLAVVMSDDAITVQQLGGDFEFPQLITNDEIAAIHEDKNVEDGFATSIYDLGA